jgi:hypothetical protein
MDPSVYDCAVKYIAYSARGRARHRGACGRGPDGAASVSPAALNSLQQRIDAVLHDRLPVAGDLAEALGLELARRGLPFAAALVLTVFAGKPCLARVLHHMASE